MCPLSKRVLLTVAVLQAGFVAASYAGPDLSSTITPEPADVTPPVRLEGDFNNDCRVGFGDVSHVLSAFIPDGEFGMHDLETVLVNFGRVCDSTGPGDDKIEAGPQDDSVIATPE